MGWQDAPEVVEGGGETTASEAAPQAAWMSAPAVGGGESPTPKTDLETAKESLAAVIKPQEGTVPGTFEYARGLGREAFLEANPLVNLGAWVIKQVTGQKTEGTLKLGPALKEPEPSFGESLQAGLSFMKDNPLTATAELAKGLLYSPELAALSFTKIPQTAARMAELANAGKTLRAVAATGGAALEGAAAMGAISAVQQAAQKEEINWGEVGASAAMGGLLVPAVKGAAAAWKGLGEVGRGRVTEPSRTPTLDAFRETVTPDGEVVNPAEAAGRQPAAEGPGSDFARNMEQKAYDLRQRGASKREVEAAIKREPALVAAMEELRQKRADAKESFNRALQGEHLGPEERGVVEGLKALVESPKAEELPQFPELEAKAFGEASRFRKERGEVDPRLLATIGVGSLGVLAGSYLAGDDKVAGAVLGGLAGIGAGRLPSVLAGLGETLSYRKALANSLRVGAVLGGGAYVGSKSEEPVWGAVIGASILLGRSALRPATRLSSDDMIRLRNGNIAAQERIIGNMKRDVTAAVPEAGRREAISDALDRGDFTRLSPQEASVAKGMRNFFDSLGKEAVDAEILRGMRQNYISYIVERDPAMTAERESSIIQQLFETGPFAEETGGSPKSRFGRQGKYESFSELNKALEGSGLRLKTKDVAEILPIYAKSMRTAIENKLLMDNLKVAKAPDGTAYLTKVGKEGKLPYGYRMLNHPQLRGYGVHPELIDSLKVVMNNSDPNVVTRGLLGLSMATKRVQVFGSLFHAKSLGEVYLNAMGADVYTKGVAPINAALKQFREGGLGDILDLGIRNGLSMKVPHDVSQTVIGNIGKAIDGLVPRLTGKEAKLGTAVTDKIDFVNGKLDHVTWDYMHAGVKGAIFLKEFETMLARNAEAHARNPGKVPLKTREQIAREVATYSNDLTGGLDWFGIAADAKTQLGRQLGMYFAGPSGQRFAQILAFAPDWALSTLRAGFKSFGKSNHTFRGLLKPENTTDLYRRYALRSALYWITLLNGMNYALTGRPIWDNKDPTRIELEDGTSVQAGKHTFEAVHAVTDPVKFAYNKLGYTPHMLIELKDRYYDKARRDDSMLEYAAKATLPFTASPLGQAGLSAGERAKRVGMSFAGLPKYGVSEEQKAARKEARAETLEKQREKKRRKTLEELYK